MAMCRPSGCIVVSGIDVMHYCFFLNFRQGQYVTAIHEYFSTFEYVVH